MSGPNFKIVKPSTEAEKTTRTTLDTWDVTPDRMKSWKLPPFQRPLRVNAKVETVAQEIKQNDGVIPGTLTIGYLDKVIYLVDGQHRREAFYLSECIVGYCDVRICHFDTMAEMGDEFVRLNSSLVTMRPDDILRGLEATYEPLVKIRKRCPFVGYDQIRRNEKAPMLSMSTALRCWIGSSTEMPRNGGQSAALIARTFSMDDADTLIGFLDCVFQAWGREAANARLWSGLNITLCMWLYRRLCITPWGPKTPKLTREMFTKCMMSVAAAEMYVDWLLGRQLCSRDVAPAYGRLKGIIAARLESELGKKALLPQPPWATSASGRHR